MSGKVKLPKEVAEAIEKLRSDRFTDEQILRIAIKDEFAKEEYYCISDTAPMTLAAALVNGYEVELSPEDKVREYYRQHWEEATPYARGVCDAIKETIDLLDIKISGVNAE